MKIYISGQITGLDITEASRRFNDAEEYLSKEYEVINPMKKVPYQEGKRWEGYIMDDLKLLIDCDVIYMLRNWQRSSGARIEYEFALKLDLKIIYQ